MKRQHEKLRVRFETRRTANGWGVWDHMAYDFARCESGGLTGLFHSEAGLICDFLNEGADQTKPFERHREHLCARRQVTD
jgi:hypothetical protein